MATEKETPCILLMAMSDAADPDARQRRDGGHGRQRGQREELYFGVEEQIDDDEGNLKQKQKADPTRPRSVGFRYPLVAAVSLLDLLSAKLLAVSNSHMVCLFCFLFSYVCTTVMGLP